MKVLRIDEQDRIAVALTALAAGDAIGDGIVAAGEIPAMHKIALRAIRRGEAILKGGQPIGSAAADIAPGEHVHTHNCIPREAVRIASAGSRLPEVRLVDPAARATFSGFRRADGRAGTRNYIGVVTSVNCSATVARQIVARAEREGLAESFGNVDGIVAICHTTGCGMQSSGEGFETLRRTLDGFIGHPNFGGVLVVGLGCEVMQTDRLAGGPAIRKLGIQEAGGTPAAIEQGLAAVRELLAIANEARRETLPASELIVALQCGGSDAWSAITANPALGKAVDTLVSHGGSAILSETPEIHGAEHLLVERARTPEIAEQLLARVAWWRDYAARHGDSLNSNPSPGNLAGGISTIQEKSLGAQAKGGSTALNAVIGYAARATSTGLHFMDSPGFDPASVTGQVAAGANLICFTTGRGSAFGLKPVPTLKLATNTTLFERMSDDMDLNCGTVVDEAEPVAACGQRIFDTMLAVASGSRTRSELLGYGDNEFTPWQLGAVY